MRLDLYLILEDVGLKDTVPFAYEGSMQRDVKNQREVHLGDVYPSYVSDEKHGADDSVSRNTAAVVMTAEEN